MSHNQVIVTLSTEITIYLDY